jgi:hypothetical protein
MQGVIVSLMDARRALFSRKPLAAVCLLQQQIKMKEGLRAGEVVGEGRIEEGGGVRGSEAPRRSTRGDQAAVCVHIDTQSSGFGSDEDHPVSRLSSVAGST